MSNFDLTRIELNQMPNTRGKMGLTRCLCEKTAYNRNNQYIKGMSQYSVKNIPHRRPPHGPHRRPQRSHQGRRR